MLVSRYILPPVADIAATRFRHAFRFVFAKLGNKKTPYKFIMVHSKKSLKHSGFDKKFAVRKYFPQLENDAP